MNKTILTDKDFELWVLIHQTRDAIFKLRENELRQHGITTMEAGVLFLIHLIGYKTTPAEISRWIFREPHTVSVLLNRMEKKGLIKKTKNLDRRNLVRISLTEKGKQAYNNTLKRESIRNTIATLSEEERQQLYSYMQKLRDKALNDIRAGYRLPFP